jgi:hypothetical protein
MKNFAVLELKPTLRTALMHVRGSACRQLRRSHKAKIRKHTIYPFMRRTIQEKSKESLHLCLSIVQASMAETLKIDFRLENRIRAALALADSKYG